MEFIEIYQKYVPTLKKAQGVEWKGRCPFPDHDDSTPSFFVNEDNGFYICFGCGRSGGVVGFLRIFNGDLSEVDNIEYKTKKLSYSTFTEPISPNIIQQLHHNLLVDSVRLQYLLRERLLSFFVIKKFLIGYDPDSDRFAFPIKSKNGKFVNIKLHNSFKDPKSISWKIGYGTPRLYPINSLNKKQVVICEGEFDCLLLHSIGINAITSTAGAKSWVSEWSRLFTGIDVYIIFDSDTTGRESSEVIANSIIHFASSVRNINLNGQSGKKVDVTDFIKGNGDIFKLLNFERRK